MTVLEVIQRSTQFLGRKGVDSPRLQVELLLAHALEVPRLKLYLDFERQLTVEELERVRPLLKRRAGREPLQLIIGSASFCGLEIKVNRDVLIPRPETEVLAERAWEFLKTRLSDRGGPAMALDFGTGSGCLAVALAHHVPTARVCALDISSAALELARQNVARHNLAGRVEFFLGDGFTALRKDLRFDLIVSNPPYIPSGEIGELAPEVRDHEPRLALDGGQDGLAWFRRLAAEASGWLAPGARLMCEFGDGQGQSVQQIFGDAGWETGAPEPDLSGRARILIAWRTEC